MDFKIRNTNLNDYPKLVEWWTWFKFPPPPIDFLPKEMKSGIIVSLDGVEICAGFIYFTNSKFAFLEYVVSNPDVKDKNTRKEALEYLIYMLSAYAKKGSAKYIFTFLKNENLMKHFKGNGYVKGSVNSTEYLKVL